MREKDKGMKALSVQEAAQYLGVSEPTIWRMLKLRVIGRLKVLGRTVVPVAELDRFMTEHFEPATSPVPPRGIHTGRPPKKAAK